MPSLGLRIEAVRVDAEAPRFDVQRLAMLITLVTVELDALWELKKQAQQELVAESQAVRAVSSPPGASVTPKAAPRCASARDHQKKPYSKLGVASGLCGPAALFGALPLTGKYVASTAMV